jgi:hypothetical protein
MTEMNDFDKSAIRRVSRALTGYRIRKQSVFVAIMKEIFIVTDPELVSRKRR